MTYIHEEGISPKDIERLLDMWRFSNSLERPAGPARQAWLDGRNDHLRYDRLTPRRASALWTGLLVGFKMGARI